MASPQATATALAESAILASRLSIIDVFAQAQARAFAAARDTPQATQVGCMGGLGITVYCMPELAASGARGRWLLRHEAQGVGLGQGSPEVLAALSCVNPQPVMPWVTGIANGK